MVIGVNLEAVISHTTKKWQKRCSYESNLKNKLDQTLRPSFLTLSPQSLPS
jgi:hypothetical protein